MKRASSELLLLDVNVLLAIAWPNHQFHAAATQRLEGADSRWATCALTQLGFIRLSSNPAVVTAAKSPAEAAALLAVLVSDGRHEYLASLPSPVEGETRSVFGELLGPGQVTDAYLLGVARSNNAILVTFDARLKGLARSAAEVEILL
jgi:toxin-antitoxin system PIN domain toxin